MDSSQQAEMVSGGPQPAGVETTASPEYDAVVILVAAVAVIATLVVAVALLPVGFNFIGPLLDRRQRARNDRIFLDRGSQYHRLNRHLPTNPRCKLCYVPFGGLGRVLGIRPSRKNSNFCRSCFELAPLGGYETDVGILFADARGFTAWAALRTPTQVAAALNRFYGGAMESLMAHDAVVDKFVGDEVMAIFIADIPSLGANMCDHMVLAAQQMMTAARASFAELSIGIGLNRGTAWVGNVGAAAIKDFTAVGDVVNVASRLLRCAGPGEIVIAEEVYADLTAPPRAVEKEFRVEGKAEVLRARVAAQAASATRT